MNRHERRAAGKKQRTASGAGARSPAALCELGHRHLQAGRNLDAQICCQEALAIDSGLADALHLMGLLSLRAEQADHAIEWFNRAVQREEKPAYLLSLGNTLRRQGRLEEAFRPLDRAVETDIESAEAWKALAGLLADLNRHNEATLSFQHVLKLDPCDADAAYQAGFLLLQSGKAEEALGLLDRSDQMQPGHAPTVQMRALVLQTLGRAEEAHAEALLEVPAPDRHSPFAAAAKSEDAVRVAGALAALEPIYREALLLRFQEELSLDEIAQVAGAPVSTISSRIHRGLAIMRSQLEGGAGAA